MIMVVNDVNLGRLELQVKTGLLDSSAVCMSARNVMTGRELSIEEICYINAEFAEELEDAGYDRYMEQLIDGEDYLRFG